MSSRRRGVQWPALTAVVAFGLVTFPVGAAVAAPPAARSTMATAPSTPSVTPAPSNSPAPSQPAPSQPASSTGSPAQTGITSPPPCTPANGTVRWVTNTSIIFNIPGSSCYPQAIFNVSVYRSAADAATYTNAVARGTGTRMDAYFGVSGLSPSTAYWYRFDGAVVAGPVYTSSSTASASPSNPPPSDPAPSEPPSPACTAGYRVLSQWPGGFYAEVAVTAADAALSGWSLGWSLAPGQRIEHAWGAVVTVPGDGTVVARNASWNGTLAAHAGTTMGFVGSWQGSNPVPAVTCR